MKTLFRLITIVLFTLFMISVSSCGSRSGRLAEQRRIEAAAQAKIEAQNKLEIERGYDAIIIENANVSYKKLNDSVVVRLKDNTFFHKRKAPIGMINTSAYRYYRVF